MKSIYRTTPESKETIEALWKLAKVILDTLDFKDVVTKIVESLLSELNYLKLGYRIIVLVLKDEDDNVLKRVSLSKTSEAEKLLEATTIPFPKMDVPLTALDNLIVKAFNDQKPYYTNNWPDILTPPFSKEESFSYQKLVEVKTSMVYPVIVKGRALGVLIFSLVKTIDDVSQEEKDLIGGFTDIVGLAVQNAQLYTALEDSSKKLENLNKKLRELDIQKDEFVSMAAHELRSPMTAIKGYLSMVLEGDMGDIPDKARGFLADANAINERLIRLVNNMLNVSRIEEGRLVYQLEKINLTRIARTVFDTFRAEADRKGLQISIEIPEKISDEIYVDPDKINEVIANLVSNAVKYTDHGFVKIILSNPLPDWVRVEVADSGPGISKEEQKRLFRKFYRIESTSGKTIGTGLGLYICKLLIEKFNGTIGLDSGDGTGSTFWFELPLARAKERLPESS